METIRLYDLDAYRTEFDAEVLSCAECKKKKNTVYEVILDQTLFFPEEGGQGADMGTINGVVVEDVQINKGIITHYLKESLQPGSRVHGCIDWSHRFSNMQQHTGEHIFSGTVHNLFGYDNVGFHLSDQVVTMDFSGPLTAEQIMQVEDIVNDAIWKNIPIEVSWPSREELAMLSYRSKKEIEGQVRIVTIPGYDACACCAPHVQKTGEIGLLKVMSVQNYKGGVRVSILCGKRALAAFREKSRIIADLMGLLTTGQDQLLSSVTKMKSKSGELAFQLSQAKQIMMDQKVDAISGLEGGKLIFDQGLEAPLMRGAVNKMVECGNGYCGVFSGSDQSGYSFIVGSADLDCKDLAGKMRSDLGSRGGGSTKMIQGSVNTTEAAIRAFFAEQ